MLTTLLTPPQQPALPLDPLLLPPQHQPGHGHQGHNRRKRTPERDEQYGRMATNSPLTGDEPNMTFDRPVPGHNPPNIVSRRSKATHRPLEAMHVRSPLSGSQSWSNAANVWLPHCTRRNEKQVMLARASITLKGEGAASNALVGTGRPDAFALLRSNKRETSRRQRKKAS